MVFQTLYPVLFSTLSIQAIALFQSWRQNPEEVGLRDWGISEALMAGASLLVVLGSLLTGDSAGSDTPSLALLIRDIAAGAASSGWILAWLSIRRIYHRPALKYWIVPAYGAAFTLLLLPGSHLPGWRIVTVALSICVFAALITWEVTRTKSERSIVTHMACAALVFVIASWLARALTVIEDLHRASGTSVIDQLCIYSSILMSMVITYALILLTNQRVHKRLLNQASMDPLTGALNRRAFFEASKPLLAALRRDTVNLAIGVVDIDHFKKINDSHGHAVGDQVLMHFSDLAPKVLRDGDLFARYGGEEFVVLLQNNSLEQATQAIERLRKAWSKYPPAKPGALDCEPLKAANRGR